MDGSFGVSSRSVSFSVATVTAQAVKPGRAYVHKQKSFIQ